MSEKFNGIKIFISLKFNFLKFIYINNEFLFNRVIRIFFKEIIGVMLLFISRLNQASSHPGFIGVDLQALLLGTIGQESS